MQRLSDERIAEETARGNLAPFKSDDCSDFGLCTLLEKVIPGFKAAMSPHCREHDQDYHLGNASGKTRWKADADFHRAARKTFLAMAKTVWQRIEFETICAAYWAGVRAGGSGLLPTPFRWGYGWKYLRAP